MSGTTNKKGAKIPWNAPDFSRRMLENHLSQEHDWASRRKDIIFQHIACITKLLSPASKVLDLGCGPGLYTQALAQLGHHCVGVDFSPASIQYAKAYANSKNLSLTYFLSDIRDYQTNELFDCIILTFGEFNVFTKKDAISILKNCSEMLRKGGLLILEAYTYEAVKEVGTALNTWQRYKNGLFSDQSYLCLQENIWNDKESTALLKYFIVDAKTAQVNQFASFMQAYTVEEYKNMLAKVSLLAQRVLHEEEWPVGNDFKEKLQVFIAEKR